MKKDWTSLRVTKQTQIRLQLEIGKLCHAIAEGKADNIADCIDNPNPATQDVSYDTFINRLLDQRVKHRERVRRSSRARRKSTRPAPIRADDEKGASQ